MGKQQGGIQLGSNVSDLLKEGTKHFQGIDEAVARNLEAAKKLADITRTSMGPQGRNKIVINHIEKQFVTSDAATIIRELEVAHPAANMLVLASKQQEEEIGDGSNLCTVFAGELLFGAASLLRMGLHVSEIIKGYQKSGEKVAELLPALAVETLDDFTSKDKLVRAIKGSVASKQYGYEDFLSSLIAQACLSVMPKNPKNFVVDNVRVCKIAGLSVLHSSVVKGMVFTRTPLGNVKHVQKAKVAVFGCAVDSANTDTTGKVLIQSADELKNYNNTEEQHMEKLIKSIADAGVKLIVSGSSVGELAAHFIERYSLMCIKIPSKFELRRFCRTVGASAMTELKEPSQEELGYIHDAREQEIGGTKCTVIEQSELDTSLVSTIVVRAATTNLLDDVERAIDDGVNCVKCLVRDGRLLSGAGACEIELARRLIQYGDTFPGLEQYAIKKYAQALEVVAKTLAENAGLDSTEIVSSLYAAHGNGQNLVGVDVENGCVGETGVVDVYSTKECALRLASDAACTILKVDQIIMSKPAGGPKMPGGGQRDDDD
eukprot:c14777_g1_i1.p1 GENE.c14777_g1_i1~~c14777_g1_i1.p1  ORF type:complete len:556 (+),score=237.30 c14777_g1_i1:33-1670(+)